MKQKGVSFDDSNTMKKHDAQSKSNTFKIIGIEHPFSDDRNKEMFYQKNENSSTAYQRERPIVNIKHNSVLSYESPQKKQVKNKDQRNHLQSKDGKDFLKFVTNVLQTEASNGKLQKTDIHIDKAFTNELYLSETSEYNSFKTYIPLKVDLPPKLNNSQHNDNPLFSTDNSGKINSMEKRKSFIFDGTQYTEYNSELLDELEDDTENNENNTFSTLSYSEINVSIISAFNNVSFDLDNLMNNKDFLAIDQDANVFLKQQYKNMRSKKTISDKRAKHLNNERFKENNESLNSNMPNQYQHGINTTSQCSNEIITIPDLSNESVLSMTSINDIPRDVINFDVQSHLMSNTNQMFSEKEIEETGETFEFTKFNEISKNTVNESDTVNMNFRFPLDNLNDMPSPSISISNKKRKQKTHSRDKSITSLNEIFAENTTTKQFDLQDTVQEVQNDLCDTPSSILETPILKAPARSPLRKLVNNKPPLSAPALLNNHELGDSPSILKFTAETHEPENLERQDHSVIYIDDSFEEHEQLETQLSEKSTPVSYKPMQTYSSFKTLPRTSSTSQKRNFLSPSRQLSNETKSDCDNPIESVDLYEPLEAPELHNFEKDTDVSSCNDSVMSKDVDTNIGRSQQATSSVSSYIPELPQYSTYSQTGNIYGERNYMSKKHIYKPNRMDWDFNANTSTNELFNDIDDLIGQIDSEREIIVIDDDDDDVESLQKSMEKDTSIEEMYISFKNVTEKETQISAQRKKRSANTLIFKMCDDTATQAKELALELLQTENDSNQDGALKNRLSIYNNYVSSH